MSQNASWDLSPPPARKDARDALYKAGLYRGDSYGSNLRHATASFDAGAPQRHRSFVSPGTEFSGGDISKPPAASFGLTIRRFSKPKVAVELSASDGWKGGDFSSAKSSSNLFETESRGIMSMMRSSNFKPVMNANKNAGESKHGFSWPSRAQHRADALSGAARRHSADGCLTPHGGMTRTRSVGDYYEPVLQTNFRAAIRQGCYSSPSLEHAVREKRMKSRSLSGENLQRHRLAPSNVNKLGAKAAAAAAAATSSPPGGLRRNRVSATDLTKLAGQAIVNAVVKSGGSSSSAQSDGNNNRVQPPRQKSASMSHLPAAAVPYLGEFAVDHSRSSLTPSRSSSALTSSLGGAVNLRGLLVENRDQLSSRGGWQRNSYNLSSASLGDLSAANEAKISSVEEEEEEEKVQLGTYDEKDTNEGAKSIAHNMTPLPTHAPTSSDEKRDALKKTLMMDDDSILFEGDETDDEYQHSFDDFGWREQRKKSLHAFDDFGWTSQNTL